MSALFALIVSFFTLTHGTSDTPDFAAAQRDDVKSVSQNSLRSPIGVNPVNPCNGHSCN